MTQHLPHLLVLVAVLVPVLPRAVQAARAAPPGRASQLSVAGTLLAAGGGHLVAAREHAGAQVGFFVACGIGQALLAARVLQHPSRRAAAVVGVLSAGLVVLWWESRTVGLGYGVEPVGLCDVVVVLLELAALVACRGLARRGATPLRLDRELAAWGLIVLAGSMAAVA